jgi:energy-coupling factor transporter ATP-binding protein EcfA2
VFLERLEIRNLRSIDHIELDFSSSATKLRERTVLLGENGCGKTTALRAVALLLAGRESLAQLLKEPGRWVRNGKKEALVSGRLRDERGRSLEISLSLRPDWNLVATLKANETSLHRLDAAVNHTPRKYFILGYGVSRRPANASEFSTPTGSAQLGTRAGGLATLFFPDLPLVSLEQWAMDLEYREGERATRILRTALEKLLPGMQFEGIDRRRREMIFRTVDGSVPFQQLSDGYQNMANWCGDVLYRINNTFERTERPLTVPGVVLIDELDLHIHPVWQRRLMQFLRSALPNMQIVATSHSPIIAQQLREGELYVVERTSPRRASKLRPIEGDPSRLTLPQLMSPMFGIETIDSVRITKLRSKARKGRSNVTQAEAAELAEVAPLDDLPAPMQAQLIAAEKVMEAVRRVSKDELPELSPDALRRSIKRPLKLSSKK